jgi:hypothetical protein
VALAVKSHPSFVKGATFAPQRCWEPVFLDGDGDGNLDNDGNGVVDSNNPQQFSGGFAVCTVHDDPTTPVVKYLLRGAWRVTNKLKS